MLKAAKEAKTHTSWLNPNLAYEEVLDYFVMAMLDRTGRNPFLADFLPFQARSGGGIPSCWSWSVYYQERYQ